MDQMEENELELESVVIDSSALADDGTQVNENKPNAGEEKVEKLVRFPLTRIKHLVKQDPDVNLCSHEALFIISKATELFVECVTKESYTFTSQAKKKTIQKRDVEQSIKLIDALAFLEGVLD